ncbi:serine/threonine-protein kinase [Actinoplanes sp. NPDC048796]|uniref:serine/threonine-protein kinase n=1 Tax=unclassified Actinoplanes TaxID=2626549 RepID=UPI0033E5FD3D
MSQPDLPGSSLLAGRYRLVERLGAGGMSVVWRGFDEVLGRQVAVKVLPPSTSTDPAFRRRLRAEAQAAARLSHPNITNVYDYGEATTADGEPVPYVVMELIDGESLAAVLARARKLPWQHAVRITAEVAAALAAAHARGIVHRDVTPANVMLTPTGAKVVDFGISALIGENDIDPDGSLLGTPAYLAPERLEGGQVSPATDVYAVGLLIYRTLIGQLPWDVGTTTALLRAHQYVEPDPLPPVEGLPAEVDALVGRCLEKRPADRPSSAELARILAALSAGAPAVARGYVPEWADDAENTTILPTANEYMTEAAAAAAAAAAPQSPAPTSGNPAAPARNSRFAGLESVPIEAGQQLRPAYGNQAAPAAGQRGPGNRTRRILVVTAGVLLLAIGTYGWSASGSSPKDKTAIAGPQVVAPTGECVVNYAVVNDSNGRFSAQVTVANKDDTPVNDWKLWFLMPGDQTISGNGRTTLNQNGQSIEVSSPTAAAIKAKSTVSVPITGRYTSTNIAPLTFTLNGATCETFVSTKPGGPPQKVEQLSDGSTRLVPTTTDPGYSIAPDGTVTITPTVKPTGGVNVKPITTSPKPGTTTTLPKPGTTTTGTTTTPATTPTGTPTTTTGGGAPDPEPPPRTTPTPTPTPTPTLPVEEGPTDPPATLNCDDPEEDPNCDAGAGPNLPPDVP